MQDIERQHTVTPGEAGQRLDQLVAGLWDDFSRNRLTQWIKSGSLTVNGVAVKPSQRIEVNDCVDLRASIVPHDERIEPQAMDLDVLFEDAELLIINKPAGMVVHPGAGNYDGTLVNALLAYHPALQALPRGGLVHRLDKDTSGCLMIAKTFESHHRLVSLLKDRAIKRSYLALVWGRVLSGSTIDQPIGRHPTDRRKQVVRADGRPAVTHYRLKKHLASSTLLKVDLETGRTHQIRVHMAHVGYPIVGDPVYGRRGSPKGLTEAQRQAWQAFPRQALHAHALSCPHPTNPDSWVEVTAPVPNDMAELIACLDTLDATDFGQ